MCPKYRVHLFLICPTNHVHPDHSRFAVSHASTSKPRTSSCTHLSSTPCSVLVLRPCARSLPRSHRMAWATWPAVVLSGLLVSLQFIMYGYHCIALSFDGPCAASGSVHCTSRVTRASCLDVVRIHKVKCRSACLLRRPLCVLLDARGIRYDVDPNIYIDGPYVSLVAGGQRFLVRAFFHSLTCTIKKTRGRNITCIIQKLICHRGDGTLNRN